MKRSKLENLDSLIEGACARKEPYIIQITSLKELYEMSAMSGVGGPHAHADEKEKKKVRNELKTEMMLRKYINEKATKIFKQKRKNELLHEMALRKTIRQLLKEGDVSDVHPHRSTGINVLEDVLKKSIPTLRADYKRLTTDKTQRESFRAHIIKAVEDQLRPSLVNDQFPMNKSTPSPNEPGEESGIEGEAGILDEPPTEGGELAVGVGGEETAPEDQEFADELAALEEAEIEVDIEDEDKKLDVEDDEGPTEEETFGKGLEGLDETGRNMAYTSFRKVSQYVLDAYDSLANMEDKEVFVDYLITNLKLY
ncbi:hypothetical protein CMI47_11690, partial [Candidatus Pacearchaeota archaeon]|nr:hypothetical protein [Candidatus Pacearchaeota archaeon]